MTRTRHPPDCSLPLRLCEVIETELTTIRGHLFAPPTWRLEPADVDTAAFVAVLNMPGAGNLGTILQQIASKLRAHNWNAASVDIPQAERRAELLIALNAALDADDDLYDPTLLADDASARLLAEVLHEKRAHAGVAAADERGNDDRTKVNRLLLEAAFAPDVVARVDTVRLDKLFRAIHALREPERITSALCLSGGGIRSASFALGVLQGLARRGVLQKFDYLSTVSGGGYVGSWLSSWIHRHPKGLSGVADELARNARIEAGDIKRKVEPEPGPLRFLRSYSHFLNPRPGLFSADTWTWIGIYLRNLSLNWLALVPLLLVLVALPRLFASLLFELQWKSIRADHLVGWGGWAATALALVTLVCVTINRPSITDTAEAQQGSDDTSPTSRRARLLDRLKQPKAVAALGLAPLVAFAMLLALLVWGVQPLKVPIKLTQGLVLVAGSPLMDAVPLLARVGMDHLVVWGELIVFVAWIVAVALLRRLEGWRRAKELVAMLVAGAFTWWLIAEAADYAWFIGNYAQEAFWLWSFAVYPLHLYVVLAVPALLMIVLAGMTVFIGIVSKPRWIEDEDREWWGRFGSSVLMIVVAWIGFSAITVFGPPLLLEFPKLITAIGGVSGLIAVLAGRSSLTSSLGQKSAPADGMKAALSALGLNTLATASVVFFAFLLAFLSLSTSALLRTALAWIAAPDALSDAVEAWLRRWFGILFDVPTHACGHNPIVLPWSQLDVFGSAPANMEVLCQTPVVATLAAMLAFGLVLLLAGRFINLNKFSLHAAYRIRIVRTFLGASRRFDRRPNAFTGFDPLDNVQMHELQPGLLGEQDFVDLHRFVANVHKGLVEPNAQRRWRVLAHLLVESDPSDLLVSRLRDAKPEKRVLRSLQKSLIQVLNRMLETARLDRDDLFRGAVSGADKAAREERLAHYVVHGHVIFANRLLLEETFGDELHQFEFPPPPPHKLVHALNLTLNLVHGRRLAWQERKAAPFAVTPMHAGSYYLGYRSARDYGGIDGISLGTAAAVSGAAVSPNMGYTSSPVTAMLLTFFNVRLGWWLGNPGVAGTHTYRLAEPVFSLHPLVAEMLGLTDDRSPYVYLSDGGHFENLGLYEMVLRRCRLIVVSDAGADPDYRFDDLGNAVRKVRIDLGIPIEFPQMPIHKWKRDGSRTPANGPYCALGRIAYSAVDEGAPDGLIIHFKPVLCGNEPADVLEYAARSEAFPQEPTLDQFFGESQFESYRKLGEHAVRCACGGAPPGPSEQVAWALDLVADVRDHLGSKPDGAYGWIDGWATSIDGKAGDADTRHHRA